jgi:hypothetical protein
MVMERPPDFGPLFRLLRDALIVCVAILLLCALLLKLMPEP